MNVTKEPTCDATVTRLLRRMSGGSQSLLMLDDQGSSWVVKFLRNPQHRRVLINEYIASRIARSLGLTLPQVARIHVGNRCCDLLQEELGRHSFYTAGIHFGSRYAGGLWPGLVVDSHTRGWKDVVNASELAGIYVVDTWLANRDRRQAVFVRDMRQRTRRRAYWIDHGLCLGGSGWDLDAPLSTNRYRAFSSVMGHNFHCEISAWIDRVKRLPLSIFYETLRELPNDWLAEDEAPLVKLMEQVFLRRGGLEKLTADALLLDLDT